MNIKTLTSLVFTVLLTACGGDNKHPEELLGTWTSACAHTNVQTYTYSYTFDEALTLTQENLQRDCTTKFTTFTFTLTASYEPELQTTSSGIEALQASIVAEDITITPHDESALNSIKNKCPNLSWNLGQPTSILTCQNSFYQQLVGAYTQGYKTLFYIDGDNLYAAEPNPNNFPLDVNFEVPYIKQ
jgi:hypothetical protein